MHRATYRFLGKLTGSDVSSLNVVGYCTILYGYLKKATCEKFLSFFNFRLVTTRIIILHLQNKIDVHFLPPKLFLLARFNNYKFWVMLFDNINRCFLKWRITMCRIDGLDELNFFKELCLMNSRNN